MAQARTACYFLPLFLSLLFGAGCGPGGNSNQDREAVADGQTARSQAELGPVRVTVEVTPATAKLSDEPVLTLTIHYERGVTIHKPPFGEAFGDFIIRDFREPLTRIEGDREIIEQIYTLEPTRTGKAAIDPIAVAFTDTRPGGDRKEHTVETEGLLIDVESVVQSEIPSLAEIRPFAGPVAVPESATRRLGPWLLGGFGCLLAGGILIWTIRRKIRKQNQEVRLSPEELAFIELDRIIQANLAEEDVKQFYVELTGVVRRYIERTKGIRAPEQTTEEFLREVSDRHAFPADENRRLQAFLESADLVKFAAHQPRKQDIEESFQRAQQFLKLSRATPDFIDATSVHVSDAPNSF